MIARTLIIALGIWSCDVPVVRPNEVGIGYNWAANGLCPRGIAVADTDRSQSANIALAGLTGQMISPSVLSSASHAPGLTATLGGDIVFPSMPLAGDELLLLDRYPKGVLSWVNVASATVRAQLSVATGYLSNPHDYVELSTQKAYVTRYNPNSHPGRDAYDDGSDILIVDPSTPAITGRIALTEAFPPNGTYIPHPDRAWLVSDRVYVTVPYYNSSYTSTGPSYVGVIDRETDSVIESVLLDGLAGCSGISVSPDQSSIAVACSGRWQGTASASGAASGIVGLRLTPKLSEIWRVPANVVGTRAFGFDVAFVDSTHVLATQLGDLGPPLVNDSAYVIDTETGAATRVLESANTPISLAIGPCSLPCGACFIVDAGRSRLFNLTFSNSHGPSLRESTWSDPTGLPPRTMAFF